MKNDQIRKEPSWSIRSLLLLLFIESQQVGFKNAFRHISIRILTLVNQCAALSAEYATTKKNRGQSLCLSDLVTLAHVIVFVVIVRMF